MSQPSATTFSFSPTRQWWAATWGTALLRASATAQITFSLPAISLESTKLFFLGLPEILLRCTKSGYVQVNALKERKAHDHIPLDYKVSAYSSVLCVVSSLQSGPMSSSVSAVRSHSRNICNSSFYQLYRKSPVAFLENKRTQCNWPHSVPHQILGSEYARTNF